MRIAIDARELAGQPTGVGRYLSEILREWGSMPEALQHEIVLCSPDGGGTMWEQRALPRLAHRANCDVLFCPGYSGPIFDTMPLVVAVHDVSFAAHPEWFRWREGLRRRIVTRASARRAALVLTLSEFSKREIVEHLGVPPERVEVVNPGVSRVIVGQGFSPANILYVGSIFNRRHVPETIRGVERLARRRPDVRLTIVGDNRTHPRDDIAAYIRDVERIRIADYVSEATLAQLYQRARAFVFLSEYEGFGLTPLEALAAGIPPVVLDTPVAREAYGDAAIYVSAPDPRLIEHALETALFDESARASVLNKAPSIVARYSWSECARRVLGALERAAQ